MKPMFSTLLLAFLIVLRLPAQNQQPVTSTIEKVTVFLRGAQVTRTAKVKIPAGRSEIVFKGISPSIDKGSIQLKGTGNFTLLSVVHQLNHLEEQKQRAEILKLEAEKRRLSDQKWEENARLSVFKQEEEMLKRNQAIGGANNGVSTAELRQAVDFQRARLTEVLMLQIQSGRAITQIDSAIAKVDLQLKALHQSKDRSTSEIIATIDAPAALDAAFELSYYVYNAGWFAAYDLRVKNVSSPIDLTFKANVYQNSGEDWNNVQLRLSSGDPSLNGVAPELQPWFLRPNMQIAFQRSYGDYGGAPGGIGSVSGTVRDAETNEPLIGATIVLEGSSIGTITDFDGNFTLKIPPQPGMLTISYTGFASQTVPVSASQMNIILAPSTELSEVVVTSLSSRAAGVNLRGSRSAGKEKYEAPKAEENYQPTTVSFDIVQPYTILNDGKTYTVEVKNMTVPSYYEYYVAPKLDENAYLTAYITDWQDLNLMDGEVNLFLEGAYLGKSLFDLKNAADTLDVSLGQDKNVVVHRTKLKEYTSRQVIGTNQTAKRAYEISVRNNKNEPISITVKDQFPISINKEITVEDQKYDEGALDPITQIITWKFKLAPREEKKVGFRYSVKYPKKDTLILD